MTRWEFDRLVRTLWAFGTLPESTVRAGVFAQVLRERGIVRGSESAPATQTRPGAGQRELRSR